MTTPLHVTAGSVSTARNGVEIRAPAGTAVQAVRAGRVVYAGWFTGYGKMVIVDHGDRLYSVYGYAAISWSRQDATSRRATPSRRSGPPVPFLRRASTSKSETTGHRATPRLTFPLFRASDAADDLPPRTRARDRGASRRVLAAPVVKRPKGIASVGRDPAPAEAQERFSVQEVRFLPARLRARRDAPR